jgi:hypothetical protein
MNDWTYSEECGCNVTFFAESRYHTSRMLPDFHCTRHSGRGISPEVARDGLLERAKKQLIEHLFDLASGQRAKTKGADNPQ